MGTCNNFCEPETISEWKEDTEHPIQQKGVYLLKCELCKEKVQHISNLSKDVGFKEHLDFCHFGQVTENKQQFTIECLLCGFQANSLDTFGNHLKTKHSYLKAQTEHNVKVFQNDKQKIVLPSKLKDQVIELETEQYKITGVKKNYENAELKNDNYHVYTYEKTYNAISYDEEKAKGDLLWRYCFTSQPNCRFYLMKVQALQTKITCCVKLLAKQISQLESFSLQISESI